MILTEDHISLTCESSIRDICMPLFDQTDINFFIFGRFYENGEHISLSTNSAWHKYFWEKDYQKKSLLRLEPGAHFWKAKEDFIQAVLDAKQFFNMDNKFEIVEKSDKFYDIFGFASTTGNNKIIDCYLNSIDFLKQFIIYFKDKASSLIDLCIKNKEHKLFIPELKLLKKSRLNNTNISNHPACPLNEIKRYFLTESEHEICLSNREMACLIYTLKGHSAAAMGKILNISPKTAESYIKVVKEKLNCETRIDLFNKAFQTPIINLIRSFDTKE